MRIISLVLLSTAAFGQTYTASTFAGVLQAENLPGTSVSLNQIGGVAVDAAGNVFLSLPRYAAVMRLDAKTGILTRFAGRVSNGFSGDNGPAVNAQLYGPNGLALDPAGNLYIADTGNRRIRKVSNGIITTVAGNGDNGPAGDGGPATSAGSIYLTALAIDAAGNLYISDFYGIRKVTNGAITSVAGAQGYFASIAVDTAGNLYLLDSMPPRILKVSNGVATTIAGNGTYGFSGDNGPATSAQFGGDPDDGGPSGIAVDPSGNVYIADTYNSCIRKVSNGVITSVACGSANPSLPPAISTQLTDPTFIALDSAGALYVSDPSGGTDSKKLLTASLPRLLEMVFPATVATMGRPPTRSSINLRESPLIPPAECTSPTPITTVSASSPTESSPLLPEQDSRVSAATTGPGHQCAVGSASRRRRGSRRQSIYRRRKQQAHSQSLRRHNHNRRRYRRRLRLRRGRGQGRYRLRVRLRAFAPVQGLERKRHNPAGIWLRLDPRLRGKALHGKFRRHPGGLERRPSPLSGAGPAWRSTPLATAISPTGISASSAGSRMEPSPHSQ